MPINTSFKHIFIYEISDFHHFNSLFGLVFTIFSVCDIVRNNTKTGQKGTTKQRNHEKERRENSIPEYSATDAIDDAVEAFSQSRSAVLLWCLLPNDKASIESTLNEGEKIHVTAKIPNGIHIHLLICLND